MNVTLPESLRGWVETQARLEGHENVDGFVEAVLRNELSRRRKEIDQLLLEGMESGAPVEADEAFWAERQRLLENFAREQGKECA